MKIKMLVGLAGADFALSPQEETDRFGDAEAKRLVEAGYAAPVAEEVVERAVKPRVAEKRG
ncbi:hypothetical protein [Shinella sp.]|uniref:hypothetical protein n=1 Tax=Shinella sp. TaxID=1870904 RepID=UPI003F70082E